MKKNLWIILLMMMTGCAISPRAQLEHNYSFTKKGVGYIFGTLTQTFVKKERSSFFDDSFQSNICFDSYLKGAKKSYCGTVVGGKNNNLDPDFPDMNGTLFLFEVPVGTHQMDYWTAREVYTTIKPDKRMTPLKFEVKEGEVLYLGNIHMNLEFAKNSLGAPKLYSLDPEVRHDFERDQRLLKKSYAKIPADQIRNKPLPAGMWY